MAKMTDVFIFVAKIFATKKKHARQKKTSRFSGGF